MVEAFTKIFLEIAERHVPSKIITVYDKDAPWITDTVKTAIRRNKRVYRKWAKNGRNKEEKNKINRIQNETNILISEAKRTYTENLSKKLCDPNCGQKVFWSSYKRLLNNNKNTNIPPISDNGTLVSDFKKKAGIFNKYFAKQCTPLVNDSVLPAGGPLTNSELSSFRISEVKISLKNSTLKRPMA